MNVGYKGRASIEQVIVAPCGSKELNCLAAYEGIVEAGQDR